MLIKHLLAMPTSLGSAPLQCKSRSPLCGAEDAFALRRKPSPCRVKAAGNEMASRTAKTGGAHVASIRKPHVRRSFRSFEPAAVHRRRGGRLGRGSRWRLDPGLRRGEAEGGPGAEVARQRVLQADAG